MDHSDLIVCSFMESSIDLKRVKDSPKGESCFGFVKRGISVLQTQFLVLLFVTVIHLSECTLLKTPPKEIVARGFVAVMGYLKRLRLGASPCKRTKLMLVGLGGAGKTRFASILIVPY